MADPRKVRFVEGSTIRYALLRWRPGSAAWFVEALRDELSEVDSLGDAVEASDAGVELATLALEGNRSVRRMLRVGRPLPAELRSQLRRRSAPTVH